MGTLNLQAEWAGRPPIITTHTRLSLVGRDDSDMIARPHSPYRYIVTDFGGTPNTAFYTRPALLAWMRGRALEPKTHDSALPPEGEWFVTTLLPGYREAMHLDPASFDAIEGSHTRVPSNGRFTLAKLARAEPHGLVTVHFLNPNCTRVEFDWDESARLQNLGHL